MVYAMNDATHTDAALVAAFEASTETETEGPAFERFATAALEAAGRLDRAAMVASVRAAYAVALAGLRGVRGGGTVRLARLRTELGGVSRDAVDAALVAMLTQGSAVLAPLADRRGGTMAARAADTAAALTVGGRRLDVVRILG